VADFNVLGGGLRETFGGAAFVLADEVRDDDDGEFINLLVEVRRVTLTCCFFFFGTALLIVVVFFFVVAMTLVALVLLSLEFDLVRRRLGGLSSGGDFIVDKSILFVDGLDYIGIWLAG
jgi:hypothetical protein